MFHGRRVIPAASFPSISFLVVLWFLGKKQLSYCGFRELL
jgi:hypothetical protein